MTTVAAPTRYSPEEIARLSDQTGKHYELVAGALVEKPMSSRANWIASRLGYFLQATYPPAKAYVFIEQPTYCFADPGEMRKPDVALVWSARLPGGPTDDELFITPDFVAEVVSPRNSYTSQMERVEQYLGAGVPLVWVIDPPRGWVHVYRRDGSNAWYRVTDTVRDEQVLPGFELKVVDLFPAQAATANAGQ